MSTLDLLNKKSYFYELPEELIAQTPLEKRDSSRMLCFDKKSGSISHEIFHDITKHLKAGDVLVVNKSRVIPARLFGFKETGAKIEILLQKRIDLNTWKVVAKPAKRLDIGTIITFNEELCAKVLKKKEYGECEIEFVYKGRFEEILDRVGQAPLPHYIKEKLKDKNCYQTVYAKVDGSSAAPTAGLHFTPELLAKIQEIGCIITEVILHVGLGTFRPVKEDNILKHDMHSEYYEISDETADIINCAKAEGRRVIAVGTTSVRVLETAGNLPCEVTFASGCKHKSLKESSQVSCLKGCFGETKIFIYPGYKFKVVDGLITNFHLPESTLIMLVSAFIGYENTMKMYKTAVEEKYRFFSFGDACLLL